MYIYTYSFLAIFLDIEKAYSIGIYIIIKLQKYNIKGNIVQYWPMT